MPSRIRIIQHEAVPKTGSFEVRFAGHLNSSISLPLG
jgi:hypothetical protein